MNVNRGENQTELRTEYGFGGRARINGRHSLKVEYKKLADHFEPFDHALEYNANVFDIKYTGIF